MKKIYIYALLALLLTSCNDYLNKEPLSSISPELYMKSEKDLNAYALKQYHIVLGHNQHTVWKSLVTTDVGTDDKASQQEYPIFQPGELRVKAKGGNWNFNEIRSCNYFFSEVLDKYKAGELSGSEDMIKHCIGEMYFLRAFAYYEKLKEFGDFPIITEVQEMDYEKLSKNSKREPRSEVARFILSDLDKAYDLVMAKSPDAGRRNRISKDAVLLFKSRVALFEACWLNNFKNTAFVPNGEGWPGKEDHPDYQFQAGSLQNEVSWLLDEAMESSKTVAENHPALVENNGILKQSESDLNNPYFFMFSDKDLSSYDEVLLWKAYDFALGITHNSANSVTYGNNYTGPTKGFVESFLMKDGSPIYAATSVAPYKGDDYIKDVVVNRDNRLQLFLKVPDQKNILTNISFCNAPPVELRPLLFHPSWTYITGYALRKYGSFDGKRCENNSADSGCPIFRTVEAYLNYMEASYMKLGNIDAYAKKYWKAIRNRAKVSDDYERTIQLTDVQRESLGDWGAYSAGKLVDATMYNIRRERRNELFSEDMRMNDLRRWRSMDQMMAHPYILEGFKLWGPMKDWYNNEDGTSTLVDHGNNPNVSPQSESVYLRPYQINPRHVNYGGFKWCMAHYLTPIAAEHFTITGGENSTIYQNPGWGIMAGDTPLDK